MGFCLLNNAAIAAEAARRAGAARVLIVDWDVHHGNGTQDIFADATTCCTCPCTSTRSIRAPARPTRSASAPAAARRSTCPLPGGQGDADYGVVFHDLFLPVARASSPTW